MAPPFPPFLPFPGPRCPPMMPPQCPFPSAGDLIAPPAFPTLPPPPVGRHRVDIETVTDYRPRRDGGFERYERLSVTSDEPIAAVTWTPGNYGPPPPLPPMLPLPPLRRPRMLGPPPPPPYTVEPPCSCHQCSRLSECFDSDDERGRAPSIVPSEACSRCSRRSSRVRSLSASPTRRAYRLPLLLDAPPGSSAGGSSYRRPQPMPTRSSRVFDMGDLESSLAETTERGGRGRSGSSSSVRSHSASPTRRSSRVSSRTAAAPSSSGASRNGAPPSSTARGRKRNSYSSTQPLSTVEEDGAPPPPSYTSRWAAQRARSHERRSTAGTNSTIRPESSISKMTARSSRRGSDHQRY